MKYYATLLFLIIPFLSFSQNKNNFQPGWIITNDENKLEGFIDAKTWEASPTEISFKEKIESEIQMFSISDISSFKVKRKNIYKRQIVNMDILPRAEGNLGKNKESKFKNEQVFLELVGMAKNHFIIIGIKI